MTVQAISHHAHAHELFILATTAKNVEDKSLMRKRTSYPLAIVRKHTSYPLAIVRKHTSY
jgi:hypothetical protein